MRKLLAILLLAAFPLALGADRLNQRSDRHEEAVEIIECPTVPPVIDPPLEYRFVAVPIQETVMIMTVLHSGGFYISGPIKIDSVAGTAGACYAFYYQTSTG